MTRSVVATLAFLLLLPSLVPAGAEEVRAQSFADGTGDVELQTADGNTGTAAPTGAENLDLVGGGVWAEDEDSVTFYLQVADLTENSQGAPFMDPDYTLDFRYRDQGYRVFVATALGNPVNDAFGRDTTRAMLQKEVGPERFQSIADAEAELLFSDEAVLATVPREAIVDQNQAPLARNATLTHLHATASSLGFFSFPASLDGGQSGTRVGAPRLFDAAPDDGAWGSYTLRTGRVNQRGGLVATSDDPVRWTNGEATTLTFTTRVTNTSPDELDVHVSTSDTDPSWQVAFSDVLTLAPGQSANATLLVTIPFVHQHGALRTFDAEFSSDDGEDFASTPLGIYWAEVPQPAGHHDMMWFHSSANEVTPPFDAVFGGVHGWFSATEEHEGDERLPLPSDFALVPGPFTNNRGIAFWGIPLEPELRMGLDFLLDEQGLAELTLDLPTPVLDPTVRVQIQHLEEIQVDRTNPAQRSTTAYKRTLLAEGTSETKAGTVSGANVFEVPLQALEDADLIPYGVRGNLYLQIILDATFLVGTGPTTPEPAAPTLDVSSSRMRLPLEEYHDPVDLSFRTDGSVTILTGDDGQERLVNPGRTVVYEFTLNFDGREPTTFHAELTGANVEWASFLGDQHFQLTPGTDRVLAVAVAAPEDARDGDVSDLTLRVTDVDNAAVQAGINVRTVVTTSEDIPDESDRSLELKGELTANKDSPGASLALLLGALAVLAAARRRR